MIKKPLYGKSNRLLWLLVILPIVLLAASFLFIFGIGLCFLKSVDPEYAYLFNGLMLAQGHPDIQYTDHPGIPLQMAVAIVSRVVHLFRPGQSLVNDILLNPETYIRATLYTVSCINAIAVFLLGLYTYRFSYNLTAAIFLQLTPFSHLLVMESIGRLVPELLMCSLVCGWLMVLVKLFFSEKEERNYNSYSIVFAILIGLSLADKLTFLPYVLLPLIILPTWKLRLRYMILSLFSFMVFAFPVVLNYKAFFRWIANIFIHTGPYGAGEKGVIDWNLFIDRIIILGTQRFLLFAGITLLIITLYYIIIRRKQERSVNITINIALAILTILLLQYIMTAKQFAYYYMMPSLLLIVFMIFISVYLLKELFPGLEKRKIPELLMGLAGLLLVINITTKTAKDLKNIYKAKAIKEEAYQEIVPLLSSTPKIIGASYYGCSAVEYALTFGIHVSGRHGNYLTEHVKELYPSTYIYFPWEKVFYEGNKEILPSSFIHPSTTYTLYIADYSVDKLNDIVAKIKTDTINYNYAVDEVFQSQATAEAVFSLKISSIDRSGSFMESIP
jgi:hypothetical protein